MGVPSVGCHRDGGAIGWGPIKVWRPCTAANLRLDSLASFRLSIGDRKGERLAKAAAIVSASSVASKHTPSRISLPRRASIGSFESSCRGGYQKEKPKREATPMVRSGESARGSGARESAPGGEDGRDEEGRGEEGWSAPVPWV